MILSAAERRLIEIPNLTLIVHSDRGCCEVRIARNGGEFALARVTASTPHGATSPTRATCGQGRAEPH